MCNCEYPSCIHGISKSILFSSKCSPLPCCCKSCHQKLLSDLLKLLPLLFRCNCEYPKEIILPASTVFPSQSFSAQNAVLCPDAAKAVTINYFLTFSNSDPSYLSAIVNIQRILSILHPQYCQANPFQLKIQLLQKLSPEITF